MSADLLDDASDLEQRERDISINAARAQANEPAPFFTHCKWCGDQTTDGAKYCSYGVVSCAADDEWYAATMKRTGRQ